VSDFDSVVAAGVAELAIFGLLVYAAMAPGNSLLRHIRIQEEYAARRD